MTHLRREDIKKEVEVRIKEGKTVRKKIKRRRGEGRAE